MALRTQTCRYAHMHSHYMTCLWQVCLTSHTRNSRLYHCTAPLTITTTTTAATTTTALLLLLLLVSYLCSACACVAWQIRDHMTHVANHKSHVLQCFHYFNASFRLSSWRTVATPPFGVCDTSQMCTQRTSPRETARDSRWVRKGSAQAAEAKIN